MTALLALALFAIAPQAAPAAGASAAEVRRIEALIASVENVRDAKFVRNGKAYDPAAAAKFLRGKWRHQARDIDSAEEFIDKVATRSSTTGRIYVVRFADGREVAVAAFLRAELQKLR